MQELIEKLIEKMTQATDENNLEAVSQYSMALQRLLCFTDSSFNKKD